MVFSSLIFLFVFLPAVLLIYYLSPRRFYNAIILVASLVFYLWGEPVYILIMIIAPFLDYTAGILIDKFEVGSKKRLIVLICSLSINLGILFVFKYSSFFISSVNALFHISVPDPKLPLPIGISFTTFQSISYVTDVYTRKVRVQKKIIPFISYGSMFPQLVAGPIVRYEDVQDEIDDLEVSLSKAGEGVALFIKGLAKKVLLANNVGLLWTEVKAEDFATLSVASAWLGIIAFSMQIYFDFSGYSDMASGLAKMLGFNFPENFNHPYTAGSVTEFWRRWHMTLTGWFKTYVYIPLGGNRGGTCQTLRNILIIWALTGLWHGASWNFVVWGLYFAAILIAEKLFLMRLLEKLPVLLRRLYAYTLVLFGWVLFDTDTLRGSFAFFRAMFGAGGMLAGSDGWYRFKSYALMLVICAAACGNLWRGVLRKIAEIKHGDKLLNLGAPVIQGAVMILCTAYLVNETYNPFLYFRF